MYSSFSGLRGKCFSQCAAETAGWIVHIFNRTPRFILFVVLLGMLAQNMQAAVINVPADQPTLQAAVTAASSGDTITISTGEYVGSGQIFIDKNLTIIGDGKTNTVLKPGFDTGGSGDARGWFLVDSGITLHMADLTLDGDTNLVYQAIRHKGNGTIENVHFTEIKYNESGPTYSGVGVAAFVDGNIDITNCMFTEIGRIGVLYFGNTIQNALFKGNTYTGKGPGDWLDYALDISAGAIVEVDSNVISNNRGVASSDGSGSAGILVSTFFGPGTSALITDNALCDNSVGIFVGFDASDASTVSASNNNISGNRRGVVSTAPTVDAVSNWWGDASGPDGEGPGTGDSVSTNVIFNPWLMMPNMNAPSSGGDVEIICPRDYFIDCEDDASPASLGEPLVNAGGPVVVTYDDVLVPGAADPVVYTIYRLWLAYDECGSSDTCTQTIVVQDLDAPQFMNCPVDQTILLVNMGDCDTTAYWEAPTAIDNCDFDGFQNYFTPSNFELNYNGPGNGSDGSVDDSGAPSQVVISGTSNGSAGDNTNTDWCINIPIDAEVAFDWSAEAMGGGAQLNNDEPAYVVDGIESILATGPNCCDSGRDTLDLNEGQQLCFRVKSNNQGATTELTLSNITFRNAVVTFVSGPMPDSLPGMGDGTPLTPGFHEVVYTAIDGVGNQRLCRFVINVVASEELLCKDINVSLDQACGVKVIPEMVLAGDYVCYDAFVVDIMDHNVSIGDSIGFEYLGETLTYRVTDPSSGNSCWGEILVEDKFMPQIFCTNDTMNCIEFMFMLEDPTVIEHCQDYEIIVTNEQITNMDCDPTYLKFITRTYVARDASGNESESCSQSVWIERFPLGQVRLPGQDTMIYCGSGFSRDANGFIDPLDVSVPMLDTLPLFPMQDFFCNLTVEYEDLLISKVDCIEKILRTWKVTEWWCKEDDNILRQQFITIIDTVGPVVTLPNDTLQAKAGRRSCDALVDMPTAIVNDACHSVERVDMVYPGGFTQGNGGVIRLPIGLNEVVYRVYDSCYNLTTETLFVDVQDAVPPVAVCEQNTVVSLDNDGVSRLMAAALDDGSFDECAIDSFSVRRMTDTCGTGTDQWGSYVDLCCADVGQDVMVEFRVTDESGNNGTCMVRVRVQDKLAPTIVGLPTIRISCRFDFDSTNLEVFGKFVLADSLRDSIILDADFVQFIGDPLDGVVRDNCPPVIEEEVDMTNLDNCGLGYIVRLFTFTDGEGNIETHSQSIFFENPTPFDSTQIIWPAHLDTMNVCGIDSLAPEFLPDSFAYPRFIDEDECSLVGYDFKDELIDPSQGNEACFTILRTWTVIDWCQKENGVHEKWTYIQVLENINTIAPVIDSSNCVDTVHCVYNLNCEPDSITLIANATDDCTATDDLFWRYKIDLGNDGSFDIIETSNDASGVYPIDTHKIKFIVEDLCGNKDSCEYLFELRNCKGPNAVCMSGMSVELTPLDTTGNDTFDIEQAMVLARDFDASSNHPCGNPLVFSFSSDVNDTVRVYDCDSLVPPTRNVEIWVTDTITGLSGICKTFVTVFDSNMVDVCPSQATGNVTGQLRTHDNRNIENVMVNLSNSGLNAQPTDDEGGYAFMDMPLGGFYDVQPYKSGDDLNGVSTADLVAIQRHLLGKKRFDNPYQLIAGDVNNSGSLSAADISELRKLILGRYSAFPSNDSWRFVDAEYRFADRQNPWKDNWPEEYHIEPFDSDMDIDFIGMKIGDVTGDAAVDGLGGENTPRQAIELVTEDIEFVAGEKVVVPLTLTQLEDFVGFQFTMEWNTDIVSFEKLIPNTALDITSDNFNEERSSEGILTTSWHTTSTWYLPGDEQKVVFSLEFMAQRNGKLSEVLKTSGLLTQNMVLNRYNEVEGEMTLTFGLGDSQRYFALYQNEPNPWSNLTKIAFHLPQEDDIRLSIFREDGALLKVINKTCEAGHNEVWLNRDDLTSGVLIYRLDTRGHTSTKKMVIID